MRIQSINQNNYKNNSSQKNTAFKMNVNVVIEGLNCKYQDLCGPSLNVMLGNVGVILKKVGILKPSEISMTRPLISQIPNQIRLVVIDSNAMEQLSQLQTPSEISAALNLLPFGKTLHLTAQDVFPHLNPKFYSKSNKFGFTI